VDHHLLTAILAASITSGTPILFAALGEIITERAGVLNLGVEGMMLVGAVTGFMVGVQAENAWAGFMAAMLAGGCMALIHAVLTISLRANQVVSGLALTIFGTGLSGYLGSSYVGVSLPASFKPFMVPGLSAIPMVGPVLFQHNALVYLSFMLVPLAWFFIFRTTSGLKLRSVGENPSAADAAGINVFKLRYIYVVVGGMLAGAGGAYLSLAYAPTWLENMTAGRGWITVALVIFAMWNPWRAVLGAYLFGGVDALGFRLQAMGIEIPAFFLKMLPYLFTIAVLIIVTRQVMKKRAGGAPGALGLAYHREER
jgi:ABC-type uncharacterized transport system permease subunit